MSDAVDPTVRDQQPDPRLVLITGMSGAGRGAAGAVLEELGWYVADNLPPELIVRLVQLSLSPDSPIERVAVVTDVRSRQFAGSLTGVLEELSHAGQRPTLLFLDASDQVLIQRYSAARRSHPLQDGDSVSEGLSREREMLEQVRALADVTIDTTTTSVHDLRRLLETMFGSRENYKTRVVVQSFGFKHGIPADADMIFDVRFLPNPYWDPALRSFRGTDAEVAEYVLSQDGAREFVTGIGRLLDISAAGFQREGKSLLTIAVGCTGGHHRSVAVAEALAEELRHHERLDVGIVHRDIDRP